MLFIKFVKRYNILWVSGTYYIHKFKTILHLNINSKHIGVYCEIIKLYFTMFLMPNKL